MFSRFFFFTFLLASGMQIPEAFAEGVKTCVASLIREEKFNVAVEEKASQLLKKMGYEGESPQFHYRSGSPLSLKDCLEGDYEEVILIAHSSEIVSNHYSILYQPENSEELSPLDGRFFKQITIGPNLRQITLAICDAEKVFEEYGALQKLLSESNIAVKFQPDSLTAAIFSGGKYKGARAQNLLPYLIAESAQDENAKTLYCLVRTKIVGVFESGKSTCLRNYFEIKYRSYLSVGLKTSTKWIKAKIRPDAEKGSKIGLLNVEVGFIRGLDFNLSKSPFTTSSESYGASISILACASLKRL